MAFVPTIITSGEAIALIYKPSAAIRDFALHFSASVVFSAIAAALLPDITENDTIRIG